jgi:hypothetical protein
MMYVALSAGGISIVDVTDTAVPSILATIGSDPFDGGVVFHNGRVLIGEGGSVSAIRRHCQWVVTESRAPDRPAVVAAPNPFRSDTAIRFELSVTGFVDWRVFDVRGRLVRRSPPKRLEAGDRTVVWDGRDAAGRSVPAGVYFVRLKSDSFTATRKVVRAR